MEGDKISRSLFVLNTKTFGDYTLKRMLKITHDVSPLKNDNHTNHHTYLSAYLITLKLEFKVLYCADTTISIRCTAIFKHLWHPIVEAIDLHLMFTQCENWMHFNYRCSFPLLYPCVYGERTHERVNVPRTYFTETILKKASNYNSRSWLRDKRRLQCWGHL